MARSRSGRRNAIAKRSQRRVTYALIGLVVLAVGGWLIKEAVTDSPAPAPAPASAPAGVAMSTLPKEVTETWQAVQRGGPYAFPNNDGTVFGNRERLLPQKPDGYYHEYTVRTPGSRDRGERRLVVGGSVEFYYTGDHYVSFVVVDPNR